MKGVALKIKSLLCASFAFLAITAATPTLAQTTQSSTPARIDVVKLVNLSCQYCRNSEAVDANLASAVQARGGRYVVAPLALGDTGGREKIYYALRRLYPDQMAAIRQSFYTAAIKNGLDLDSEAQTMAWLNQDESLKTDFPWKKILEIAESQEVRTSIGRALYLAKIGGVTSVPAWIILKNGAYLATVDSGSQNLSASRNEVLSYLKDK